MSQSTRNATTNSKESIFTLRSGSLATQRKATRQASFLPNNPSQTIPYQNEKTTFISKIGNVISRVYDWIKATNSGDDGIKPPEDSMELIQTTNENDLVMNENSFSTISNDSISTGSKNVSSSSPPPPPPPPYSEILQILINKRDQNNPLNQNEFDQLQNLFSKCTKHQNDLQDLDSSLFDLKTVPLIRRSVNKALKSTTKESSTPSKQQLEHSLRKILVNELRKSLVKHSKEVEEEVVEEGEEADNTQQQPIQLKRPLSKSTIRQSPAVKRLAQGEIDAMIKAPGRSTYSAKFLDFENETKVVEEFKKELSSIKLTKEQLNLEPFVFNIPSQPIEKKEIEKKEVEKTVSSSSSFVFNQPPSPPPTTQFAVSEQPKKEEKEILPSAPSFQFNDNKKETPKFVFPTSFGGGDKELPTKPAFSFNLDSTFKGKKENEPIVPAFNFPIQTKVTEEVVVGGEKQVSEPSFGLVREEEDKKLNFSIEEKKESEPKPIESKPFVFGEGKPFEPKPFVFGEIKKTESQPFGEIKQTDSKLFGEVKPIDSKPFVFGEGKPFDSKPFGEANQLESKPFVFGEIKQTESKPFGEIKVADSKPFAFGEAKQTEFKPFGEGKPADSKPFVFGEIKQMESKPFGEAKSFDQKAQLPQQPAFSFGNSTMPAEQKPSFSFSASKPAFSFGPPASIDQQKDSSSVFGEHKRAFMDEEDGERKAKHSSNTRPSFHVENPQIQSAFSFQSSQQPSVNLFKGPAPTFPPAQPSPFAPVQNSQFFKPPTSVDFSFGSSNNPFSFPSPSPSLPFATSDGIQLPQQFPSSPPSSMGTQNTTTGNQRKISVPKSFLNRPSTTTGHKR